MNKLLSGFSTLIVFILSFSSLAAQGYQFFTNTQQISIPDIGPASTYPSLITVSGQPPYLHEVKVHFESVAHQFGFDDVDILLEAPNGQRVVLCSDALNGGILIALNNLWFGTSNFPSLTIEALNDEIIEFRPDNFGTLADAFPAPGPGVVAQPVPSLHTLDGINPNGIWKLWVVSDDENGAIGSLGYNNIFGDFGWQLAIKSVTTPPCARPERPEIVMVEDSFAIVSWPVNGMETAWDLYYALEPVSPPNASTPPTLNNVSQPNNITLTNLQPNREHSVWVRSDCGNSVSAWIGPLQFRTKIYPCKNPPQVEMCESFDLLAMPFFTHWAPSTCTGVTDGTPKRMIQFTPPVSGTYNVTGLQYNPLGRVAYKQIGTCDTVGWICWQGPPLPYYEMDVDLEGGVAYWFYFDEVGSQNVRFNACPFTLDPQAGSKLVPFAVSPSEGQFRWYEENNGGQAVGGDWDIFCQPFGSTFPGFLTTPTEPDSICSATRRVCFRCNKTYNPVQPIIFSCVVTVATSGLAGTIRSSL